MNKRLTFEIGREYGWLTLLEEVEKSKTSHRQFLVRCRCGKTYVVGTGFLNKREPKCWECSHTYDMEKRVQEIVGKTINGWYVELPLGKVIDNKYRYYCRCTKCGKMAIKSRSEIANCKGKGCVFCHPDYQFVINGETAVGTLRTGEEFIVDADDVDRIKKKIWRIDPKGYILSTDGGEKVFLHRFVLGYSNNKDQICIDHINRIKTDCRKSNLRIVSAQQNSMNRSIGSNNTTGYIGVVYLKHKDRYRASIGLNNKRIYLGTSKDPAECAMLYNYAAQILFKEYAGEKNPVGELPEEQKLIVLCRIAPYLEEAAIATQRG